MIGYNRLLLSVMPEGAPDGALLAGFLLFLGAAVHLAFILAWALARGLAAGRVTRLTIPAIIALTIHAGRYWISAYHRDLLMLNNALVVVYYGLILLFAGQLLGTARSCCPQDELSPVKDAARNGARSVLLTAAFAALAVQVFTTAVFVLSPFNGGIRVIEAAFFTVTILSLVVLSEEPLSGNHRWTPLLRWFLRMTGVFAALTVVLYLLRGVGRVPSWVDPALLLAVYVIAVSLGAYRRVRDMTTSEPVPVLTQAPALSHDTAAFLSQQATLFRITPREQAILELLMTGASTEQIAKTLGMSTKTVRNHISSMYQKTEVGNRVELIRVFEPA